jgi:thymidylate synthase
MHTTMRSQDLWLGFCYDVFADTVVHELMAGWVGAELGAYHHHIGSLHLYDEHLPYARDLTAAHPRESLSPVMAPLTLPWEDLDGVLRAVIDGAECRHPGWSEITEVMRSYRIYKSGDVADGRAHAHSINGPLGRALTAWYTHLARAAGLLPTAEHAVGRAGGA